MSDLGVTDHGFTWGPLRLSRIATFKLGRGRLRVVGIDTDHHRLQISVSATGRSVRVWLDGRELK